MILVNSAPDSVISGFQPQIAGLLGHVNGAVSEFQQLTAAEHMRRQRVKKRRRDAAEGIEGKFPMQGAAATPAQFHQQLQNQIHTPIPTPAPASAFRASSPQNQVIDRRAQLDEETEREKKQKMSIQALLSLDSAPRFQS